MGKDESKPGDEGSKLDEQQNNDKQQVKKISKPIEKKKNKTIDQFLIKQPTALPQPDKDQKNKPLQQQPVPIIDAPIDSKIINNNNSPKITPKQENTSEVEIRNNPNPKTKKEKKPKSNNRKEKKELIDQGIEKSYNIKSEKLFDGMYEIQQIKKIKVFGKNQLKYLIKWKGWGEEANTWEPFQHIKTCYPVLKEYYDQNRASNRITNTNAWKLFQGLLVKENLLNSRKHFRVKWEVSEATPQRKGKDSLQVIKPNNNNNKHKPSEDSDSSQNIDSSSSSDTDSSIKDADFNNSTKNTNRNRSKSGTKRKYIRKTVQSSTNNNNINNNNNNNNHNNNINTQPKKQQQIDCYLQQQHNTKQLEHNKKYGLLLKEEEKLDNSDGQLDIPFEKHEEAKQSKERARQQLFSQQQLQNRDSKINEIPSENNEPTRQESEKLLFSVKQNENQSDNKFIYGGCEKINDVKENQVQMLGREQIGIRQQNISNNNNNNIFTQKEKTQENMHNSNQILQLQQSQQNGNKQQDNSKSDIKMDSSSSVVSSLQGCKNPNKKMRNLNSNKNLKKGQKLSKQLKKQESQEQKVVQYSKFKDGQSKLNKRESLQKRVKKSQQSSQKLEQKSQQQQTDSRTNNKQNVKQHILDQLLKIQNNNQIDQFKQQQNCPKAASENATHTQSILLKLANIGNDKNDFNIKNNGIGSKEQKQLQKEEILSPPLGNSTTTTSLPTTSSSLVQSAQKVQDDILPSLFTNYNQDQKESGFSSNNLYNVSYFETQSNGVENQELIQISNSRNSKTLKKVFPQKQLNNTNNEDYDAKKGSMEIENEQILSSQDDKDSHIQNDQQQKQETQFSKINNRYNSIEEATMNLEVEGSIEKQNSQQKINRSNRPLKNSRIQQSSQNQIIENDNPENKRNLRQRNQMQVLQIEEENFNNGNEEDHFTFQQNPQSLNDDSDEQQIQDWEEGEGKQQEKEKQISQAFLKKLEKEYEQRKHLTNFLVQDKDKSIRSLFEGNLQLQVEPSSIIAIDIHPFISEEFIFKLQWNTGTAWVEGSKLRKKFPQILISFYEEYLQFAP